MSPFLEYRTSFERSGNIRGYKYKAITNYFSQREFFFLPEFESCERNCIYNFKNGNQSMAAAIKVADLIEHDRELREFISNKNVCSCIIPASTKEKNQIRFKSFMQILSELLKIENGFSYIDINFDHSPTKGNKDKKILNYLSFNSNKLTNKSVLLFDDIITTGKSFEQCANHLISIGVIKIYGVFLSKTYNQITEGRPYWIDSVVDNSTLHLNTYEQTYSLVLQKLSFEKIASKRGFQKDTIIKHFFYLVEQHGISNFQYLRPDESIINEVKQAKQLVSDSSKLSQIFDFLDGKYSYIQIKMALLFINNE